MSTGPMARALQNTHHFTPPIPPRHLRSLDYVDLRVASSETVIPRAVEEEMVQVASTPRIASTHSLRAMPETPCRTFTHFAFYVHSPGERHHAAAPTAHGDEESHHSTPHLVYRGIDVHALQRYWIHLDRCERHAVPMPQSFLPAPLPSQLPDRPNAKLFQIAPKTDRIMKGCYQSAVVALKHLEEVHTEARTSRSEYRLSCAFLRAISTLQLLAHATTNAHHAYEHRPHT